MNTKVAGLVAFAMIAGTLSSCGGNGGSAQYAQKQGAMQMTARRK